MIDRGKREILGVHIDAVDYEACVARIIDAAEREQPLGVSALAVHGVMTGALDREHRYRLNALDLVVPDGQPVRWALNLLYRARLPERVYGPNLMLWVCEEAARRRLPIYFYGSRPEVLEALSRNLTARFPDLRIAGWRPSAFRQLSLEERTEMIRSIRDSGAKIVYAGLGCPRQEVWVYENVQALGIPVLAVGAAFDFYAGTQPQAPAWMQSYGLEWLFRLKSEPQRLWRRYLLLNPTYLALLACQAAGLPFVRSGDARRPERQFNVG